MNLCYKCWSLLRSRGSVYFFYDRGIGELKKINYLKMKGCCRIEKNRFFCGCRFYFLV